MLKKGRLLTRPTLAVISPSRPESAKTDSLPWDAPYPKQGRSERSLLKGYSWNDPNCEQYSTQPALSDLLTLPTPSCFAAVHPRRALIPSAFQFPLPPFRGVAKAALNCAHRTSTVSSCAFCEHGGHLAAPSSSFRGRALREHRDSPGHLTPPAVGHCCASTDRTRYR